MAVDLDGTLLAPSGEPHAEDVAAIRGLKRLGVHVTIITGRMYSGTRGAAQALGLEGPVACVDGAQIVDTLTDRPILHATLGAPDADLVRDTFAEHGDCTFLLAGDEVIHDEGGREHLAFMRVWSPRQRPTVDVLRHDAWHAAQTLTAVVALGDREKLQRAADALEGRVSKLLFKAPGHDDFFGLYVRALGFDKGGALTWLAAHHGVALADTVAVGDWLNDVPMLKLAGRSFAMGHAPPEVCAVATDRLEQTPQQGGGVARAIERALATSLA